jgi:hypothetical protein
MPAMRQAGAFLIPVPALWRFCRLTSICISVRARKLCLMGASGKEARMDKQSPFITGLLIVFAVIGFLAAFTVLGMLFMHDGMMGSFGQMMAACQSMMAAHR